MRILFLPMVLGGLLTSAIGANAQEMMEKRSDDPLVQAAYAKTETPSGVPYRDKDMGENSQDWFEGDLEVAKIVFGTSPLKESSYSWRGRREGFMGNYAEAINIFTQGLELFPESYALYRYRGFHLVRNYQFEEGLIDLRLAEELIANVDVSPIQEGIPGRSNFSPSTFKRNIYFYIAESSMATADYNTVIEYMDKAYETNQLRDKDDFLVSTAFYKYMAMRKMGRHDEAMEMIRAIPNGLDIIENHSFYDAVMFLKGRTSRERFEGRADSLGKYAMAMVDLFEDKTDNAKATLTQVTNENPKGYWLAEVELSKL